MKGIVNASIAGIAFRLEEEAFSKLENYLDTIRKHYGNLPEGEEILGDIEARIAEIILTRQNASVVVSLPLIDSILEQLGSPEVISDGVEEGEPEAAENRKDNPTGQRIIHRLYRDSEKGRIAGVCSGLAAYFRIDTILVRLIFLSPAVLWLIFLFSKLVFRFYVLRTLSLGWTFMFAFTLCLVYLVLWIVIPKARTPLQKMEMRGEKVTKESLEENFRQEFQSRSNTPQSIQARAKRERNASIFAEFFSIIGRLLLFCVKAVVAVLGFGLVAALVALVAAIVVGLTKQSIFDYDFSAENWTLLLILTGLVLAIPLSLLIYAVLRALLRFKNSKPFVTTMLVVWVLTLVFATVILVKEARNGLLDDFYVDVFTSSETIQINNDNRFRQEKFSLRGDRLTVVSLDDNPLPVNVEFSTRKKEDKGKDVTLVLWQNLLWEKGKRERYAAFEFELRQDTLFVKTATPSNPNVSLKSADISIVLPKNVSLEVDPKLERKNDLIKK